MHELKGPIGVLDPEEVRIFRQSIPKQEVTRDFLEDLLNEHRGNSGQRRQARRDDPGPPAARAQL